MVKKKTSKNNSSLKLISKQNSIQQSPKQQIQQPHNQQIQQPHNQQIQQPHNQQIQQPPNQQIQQLPNQQIQQPPNKQIQQPPNQQIQQPPNHQIQQPSLLQPPIQQTLTHINSDAQLHNSSAQSPISSQIVNTNPISQTQELNDNIKQIKKNIDTIINISAPLIEKTTSITCDIAKKISDTICSANNYLNNNINNIKNNYNMLDESVNNSINKVQNLNEAINMNGGGYIKPKDYRKQNLSNKNKYQYIINPITKRKVSIYTKLGNKIIQNYLHKVDHFNFKRGEHK